MEIQATALGQALYSKFKLPFYKGIALYTVKQERH
jgi:hypothetical protein